MLWSGFLKSFGDWTKIGSYMRQRIKWHITAINFEIWAVAWQLDQPIPSGLWDVPHNLSQACVNSGCSDGLKPDLLLPWERLCSPTLCLAVLLLESWEDRDNQWTELRKFLSTLAFSLYVFISLPFKLNPIINSNEQLMTKNYS